MDAEKDNDFNANEEKAVIADMLINKHKHSYFCKMQEEGPKAKRMKYMKRIVGHGASGCRHSDFVAAPCDDLISRD